MSAKQLVNNLIKQGIHLEADGEQLKIKARKGALTSSIKDSIKNNKQDLLHFLNNQTPDQRRKSLPLVPVSRTEDFPLSFAQQSLWLSYQITGGGPAYNILGAMHLQGELDETLLENCFVALIERHESMRARIEVREGTPCMAMFSDFDRKPLNRVELPVAKNEKEQKSHITQWAQEELEKSFDLKQAPLYRFNLLALGKDEYLLCLTIHHIICDALSIGVLFRELFQIYDQYSKEGKANALAPLDIQYADFAYWQRLWLTDESLDTQRDYWLNKLADGADLINLPTDFPRPSQLSHAGAVEFITFDSILVDRLRQLSQECGASLYMTVLTCLSALLAKYSGQEKISLGSPFSHRTDKETEALVGFFINTIVLQNNINQEQSIKSLIASVRNNTLEAFAHADYPFERLVADINPQRSSSFATLFQIMFVFLPELPSFDLKSGKVKTRRYQMPASTAKFDLEFTFEQLDGELQLRLDYSKDLFKAETVQRLLAHLHNVLVFATENSDAPISQLDISTPEERQQVSQWQKGQALALPYRNVAHIFEAQAELHPKDVALHTGTETLTYQELNQRANRLAHYLSSHGVAPGDTVALYMERSFDLFTSILAVLKAGAAYLPLDIDYPPERIQYMLSNSHCALLLEGNDLADEMPVGENTAGGLGASKTIRVDSLKDALMQQPEDNLNLDTKLNDTAYVIYTSGSTGIPKGVDMTQGALCNLVAWHQADDTFFKHAKVLQYSPISFDVSFQEAFTTWGSGGCLYLLENNVRKDPGKLIQFINEQGIERLFLPFVALDQLAQLSSSAKKLPTQLKEVYVAGEQLKITPQIRQLFKSLGKCRLINHYGPSETHVVTALSLDGSPSDWPALPSIGKPVPNAELKILDNDMKVCVSGVVGELFIGGQVAKGYVNQTELSAERFVYLGEDNKLFYRSGDLARWLPNGDIEFLGRVDQQIKIRGYRIELGEIEACLQKYDGIAEVAVEAQQKEEGLVLVAYYTVSNVNLAPGAAELKFFLEKKLPEYMVPAQFVKLDTMPLTASGKLDRKSLPSLDISREELEIDNDYVAPESEMEIALTRIWQDMLEVDAIGIEDDFFDLGGNSIVATRLGAKIHQLYQVELDLQAFFSEPDISHLAKWLDVQLWAQRSNEAKDTSKADAEMEVGEI